MKKKRGFCVAALLVCLVSLTAAAGKDGAGEEASALPPDAPLVMMTAEFPKGMAGVEYYGELSAEGGIPPYVWKPGGDLPPGVDLDGEGHSLKGIPSTEGSFSFSLQVTDSAGASTSRDCTIHVIADPMEHVPEPTPIPLAITVTGLPEARLGREYSATLRAEGGVPPYLWLIAGGGLPRGLVLEGTTGALEGVPQLDGEYDFTVAVRDTEGELSETSYRVPVKTVRVYITTGLLPDAIIGEQYDFGLSAVGGATPYWWKIEEGKMPAGLVLDAETGVISGIPEESASTWAEGVRTEVEPGLFRAAVVDALGSSDRAEFRIIVNERSEAGGEGDGASSTAPTVIGGSSSSSPAKGGAATGGAARKTAEEEENEEEEEEEEEEEDMITVVTDRLPAARLENEYAADLEAAGGTSPYTWCVSGALPPGLSMDAAAGSVQGEPTEAGEFLVGIQASDTQGKTSEVKQVPLTVKEVLQPVTDLVAAGSDGKVGLAWVNPSDSDVAEVRVLRRLSVAPADSEDGETVYAGNGDNTVDTGLENGLQYHYAAYALDSDGYESGTEESSFASAGPMAVTLSGEYDPFGDEVISFNPLAPAGFGAAYVPGNVLGPPYYDFTAPAETCQGYVVSLHAKAHDDGGSSPPYGGSITLKFGGNIVVNEEGPDFTVYGNGFYISLNPERMWIEPAVVEVSQDGSSYYPFPTNYVEHGDFTNPYAYNSGFAGIRPAKSYSPEAAVDPLRSGGDQFDLDSITAKELTWISYVRVTATGDRWLTDSQGDQIRHTSDNSALSGDGKSGFDLDAIAAIHY